MPALAHPELLHVETTPDGTVVRLTLRDFDDTTAHMLAQELFDLAQGRGENHLCLDFEQVEYLSSGTLGALLVLDRKLQDAGGCLHLRNLQPQVYEVLQVARLTDFIDACPCGRNR